MGALARLLAAAAAGQKFVVEGAADRLTAVQFEARANSICDALRARGALPGEAVIVKIANRPSDLAAYYGVWLAGMVVVPVHVGSPPAAAASVVERVGARLAVDDGRVLSVSERAQPRVHETGLAFIIFTSGSTGEPKGTRLTHEAFAGKLETLQKYLHVRPDDIVVMPLQLTFVMGIWCSLVPILSGARLRVMPKFSADLFGQAIAGGATIGVAVPSMFRTVLKDGKKFEAPLRAWWTGGEALGAVLGRRVLDASPQAAIIDMYGSTETSACDFCFDSSVHPDGFGTIGVPTPGVRFRIVDAEGREVAGDEQGELVIKTPFITTGYHDNPVQTEAAFLDGYYRTGDIARRREDGLVQITGRKKDIISRGGNKIAPLEIDELFARHPEVEAAMCAGIADTRLGEALHVMVVRRKGTSISDQDLRSWASQYIERYKIPDGIHFVEELPLGRTGKADRGEVRRRVEGQLSRV